MPLGLSHEIAFNSRGAHMNEFLANFADNVLTQVGAFPSFCFSDCQRYAAVRTAATTAHPGTGLFRAAATAGLGALGQYARRPVSFQLRAQRSAAFPTRVLALQRRAAVGPP